MSEPHDPFEQWLLDNQPEPIAAPPGTYQQLHRRARRIRTTRAAGSAALTVLGVAAVAGGLHLITPAARQSTAPGLLVEVSTPATGDRLPTPTTPDASAKVRGSAPAAQQSQTRGVLPNRCSAAQLRITVERGDADAGHTGLSLRLTNTSAAACGIFGYPGVSFVDQTGQQINDPARRAPDGRPAILQLAPGGSATAALHVTVVANYPADACGAVTAAGVRVYPPDDTESIVVATPVRVCSNPGVGVAQIQPVQPG